MVINSPCLTEKKELAIPGQTTTGKELSNPLIAGSLPKTTLPTQLMKVNAVRHTYYCQKKVNAAKHKLTTAGYSYCWHDLQLNDAEGTSCLPNAMFFEELARIGYEKPFEKLTFYKALFSPQWKFFIHTILQCLSAKTTSWNEFSSTMASAIICLANNQKFNFSKYILDNLKKNLEAGVPFYMFPRKHKPRRKESEVSPLELPTEEHVPTPSNDPLSSGEDSMPLKELMVLGTNLSNKVLDLENEVIEIKSSHKTKIAELESRVEKLEEETMSLTKELKSFNSKVEYLAFKETVVDKEKSSNKERKIADIDADAKVNLENVYNLDLVHEETVLSMQYVTDADEPVSVAPTNVATAQPSEATKTNVDITTAPKAKGIVFHDVKESTTRTASSKAQVKDKGKAKLVKEPEEKLRLQLMKKLQEG
nr:hypothetical protein [Tanacetum cinerariifolium]